MDDPNNPAGNPPTSEAPSMEVDLNDVLFGDTSAEADAIAARLAGEAPAQTPPAASTAQTGAGGEVGSAPATPPDTPSPTGTEAQPTPATPAPTEGTPPAPAATAPSATPPVAPQPQPVDERALREASLTAQVSALTAELERVRGASPQPAQPGTAPESGQPSGQPAPLERFNLTLPPEVVSAVFSDDEQTAAAGLNRVVNDLGTIVYHTVLEKSRAYTDGVIQRLVSQAEQGETEATRAAAREAGQTEYFNAFPDHNNALIKPIISLQASQMAAEFPHLKWGPDYINALGARVNSYVASLSGGGAPPAEPNPAPAPGNPPPARPAAMIPVGSRSGGAPGSEAEGADLIAETLNVF